MIPKIIHYIWLGQSSYSDKISSCIESWKNQNPEFKIIKWDETNIPKGIYFVNYMIKKKKWAFASDCLRFWILYNYGGIYLDTDMKVFKNLSPMLNNSIFLGKENTNTISGGIIGSEPKNIHLLECLNKYLEINDIDKINAFENNNILIPKIITDTLKMTYKISEMDITESFDKLTIYQSEYFYPVSFSDRNKVNSFIPNSDKNFAIHLWEASWHNEFQNLIQKKFKKSLKIYLYHLFTGQATLKTSIKFIKLFVSQLLRTLVDK